MVKRNRELQLSEDGYDENPEMPISELYHGIEVMAEICGIEYPQDSGNGSSGLTKEHITVARNIAKKMLDNEALIEKYMDHCRKHQKKEDKVDLMTRLLKIAEK